MEKEKLLKEYEATLESLIEKTKFVYSNEFYALDEFEKQKFVKDKMATEGHLGTLCNLIWSKTPQIGGFNDLFALGIISSMFGWSSPFSPTTIGTGSPKKELENFENVENQ